MTRRKLLSYLPIAGCAPLYAFGVEPNWLDRTFHRIPLAPHKRAAARILHLSDFHASPVVPFSLIENAIQMGLDAKPDIICLTGDFVTDATPVDQTAYARVLRRLSGAAPTFATLGNHDGGSWGASVGGLKDSSMVCGILSDAAIPVLHNRSELVRVRDGAVRVAGVGDLWSNEVDAASAFADVQAHEPVVLLAHNPDTKDAVADQPWDLILSGHTHGGQVALPFLGNNFIPVRDKRFIAGLIPWNNRHVYVTRGVGSIASVRVNCRPEVTILDLA